MSIGQTLVEARERAGLTEDEVARATCIRRTLLQRIEQDDFSACGGDFYARGHVRNLARVVGLDPAVLLDGLDAERALGPSSRAVPRPPKAGRPERRGPNWSAAMALALVLTIVYGVVQVLYGS